VSFAAITLCVASQRVFIIVSVYFVIDSVRKLLDTLYYSRNMEIFYIYLTVFPVTFLCNSEGFLFSQNIY
jgi:hypothetical protein